MADDPFGYILTDWGDNGNRGSGGTDIETNKQVYDVYVKGVIPTRNIWPNIFRAFLVGGVICTIGQAVSNWLASAGMDEKTAISWNPLLLIALSTPLAGLGIYPKIVKWAGVGALVPITGLTSSVVASAIEHRARGQVFDIGCKIFIIADPVILYGIFSSWVPGVIYWVFQMMGVVGA